MQPSSAAPVSEALRRSRAPGLPPPPAVAACATCGFCPPRPDEVAAEVRSLPSIWAAALPGDDDEGLVDEAARLRDELHAVAKRIERLLDGPGSRVSAVRIEIPTASARGAGVPLVLALLGDAAEHLAQVAESLHDDDWHVEGWVGTGRVSVYELACVPLHATHRRLTTHKRRAEDELMVLAPCRWASARVVARRREGFHA